MYSNGTIPRYKINVDPHNFPTDAFIDDIYYGSYTDADDERTILTNSIPFDLNETKHDLIYTKDDETDKIESIHISMKENYEMVAEYVYNNQSMKVLLFEGDRIFINPNSIFDINLSDFVDNKLKYGENYYYGFVTKSQTVDKVSSLIIEIKNIRNTSTNYSSIVNVCYDKSLNQIMGKNERECLEDQENTWETPCKYNYECPFFKSNSNYTNNFGGCDVQTGTCQMPRGINKQSFKRYSTDEENQPLCYNCSLSNTSESDCCDNFKSNNNLVSSDYMFTNDTQERIKHLFTLNDSNCSLLVNKYI
jgi:hypothetical protein